MVRVVTFGASVVVMILAVTVFVAFFLAFVECMPMGNSRAVVRSWYPGVGPGCMPSPRFVLSPQCWHRGQGSKGFWFVSEHHGLRFLHGR